MRRERELAVSVGGRDDVVLCSWPQIMVVQMIVIRSALRYSPFDCLCSMRYIIIIVQRGSFLILGVFQQIFSKLAPFFLQQLSFPTRQDGLKEALSRFVSNSFFRVFLFLLDGKFNAKLADFGLARRIDRNQSQVTTQMRGTRGYMAPEWLSGKLTEKVDVYSFGVVILEVVCGRKNLDYSLGGEDCALIPKVKQKAEENRLADLVDVRGGDLQQHLEEAVEMIEIAIRCLHFDPKRRPSMSVVLKVLGRLMTMEPIFDYSFLVYNYNYGEVPPVVVMELSEPEPDLLSGAG